MAGNSDYEEARVRDNSAEEETVKQNFAAQGWDFMTKVDDASSPGYVVLTFKKRGSEDPRPIKRATEP